MDRGVSFPSLARASLTSECFPQMQSTIPGVLNGVRAPVDYGGLLQDRAVWGEGLAAFIDATVCMFIYLNGLPDCTSGGGTLIRVCGGRSIPTSTGEP